MIAPLTTDNEDSPADVVGRLRSDDVPAPGVRTNGTDVLETTRPEAGGTGDRASGDHAAVLLAPALAADDATWWTHARCSNGDGTLNKLFFSDDLGDIARAKHICATCPALIPCLEGALERREPWGVWGGQLFRNGKILASKRRRGRPPKRPRPEDQLPDIPIPEHLQSVAVVRIA
jgi:WhiB family transcriptional regulator, redox-sensing transcriptional regulator